MSVRVDMTSTDLDRQMALLRFYPEIMEKHFRARLETATNMAEEEIRPNIPKMTSKARNTFKSRVIDTKMKSSGMMEWLSGQVGWWGKNTAWYINVVEYGSKAHEMNSYVPRLGVYIKQHPGFSARGFMAAGFSAIQPIVNAEMAAASEAVVRELVVP